LKIDWHKPADAGAVHRTTATLTMTRGHRRPKGLESMVQHAAPVAPAAPGSPRSEHQRIDRLKDALNAAQSRMPAERRADPEVIDHVISGAQSGLAKALQGDHASKFIFKEQLGLEAVILTNGERPSLVVHQGFIDVAAPDVGDWDGALKAFSQKIKQVITSVGRINVPPAPGFVGTCFVVADGLVLTNRHVLEVLAQPADGKRWTLNWPDATTVDFFGEEGGATSTSFRVTGVAFAGPDPINDAIDFSHLDAAILRVDPASSPGARFPQPVVFEKDVTMPTSDRDLYVVGFPGRPRNWFKDGKPLAGFETVDVLTSLFQQKFGVKRLAPGRVTTGAGQMGGDPRHWIFAHDASTLGGNSGSCVADLTQDGLRVIGLHFGGAAREQNWAHVAARLHDALAANGGTFV
jgi:hypothetical protein